MTLVVQEHGTGTTGTEQVTLCSSQTSLVPTHQPWRDGRLVDLGGNPNQEHGISACDCRHLLRQRLVRPFFFLAYGTQKNLGTYLLIQRDGERFLSFMG